MSADAQHDQDDAAELVAMAVIALEDVTRQLDAPLKQHERAGEQLAQLAARLPVDIEGSIKSAEVRLEAAVTRALQAGAGSVPAAVRGSGFWTGLLLGLVLGAAAGVAAMRFGLLF